MIIRRTLSAFLAAIALVFLPLGPAALAHDDLTSTSPADGESVAAGAFDVTVTSAEDIMNMADMTGNEIVVSGPIDSPESSVVSQFCIRVEGANASVPVDIDQPGTYTATWRLVSQDGHPVDGSFSFNVTNDSGYVASETPVTPEGCTPFPMATATAYDGAEATPEVTSSIAPESTDQQWVGLLIGIGFVVVGSLAGVGVVAYRERNKRDAELIKKLAESDPEL